MLSAPDQYTIGYGLGMLEMAEVRDLKPFGWGLLTLFFRRRVFCKLVLSSHTRKQLILCPLLMCLQMPPHFAKGPLP